MSRTDLCAATVAKSREYKVERAAHKKEDSGVEGRNYHLPVIPLFLALGEKWKKNLALRA